MFAVVLNLACRRDKTLYCPTSLEMQWFYVLFGFFVFVSPLKPSTAPGLKKKKLLLCATKNKESKRKLPFYVAMKCYIFLKNKEINVEPTLDCRHRQTNYFFFFYTQPMCKPKKGSVGEGVGVGGISMRSLH